MSTKKVTKSIEVVVNLGNYQSIRFVSGVEQDVVYSSQEMEVALQHEIWCKLHNDIVRAATVTLTEMGKPVDIVERFFDACHERSDALLPPNPLPEPQTTESKG